MNIDGIVRTGLHASLAANTSCRIEVNDGIFTDRQTGGRTHIDAGSISAMITAQHMEGPFGPGMNPFLQVLDPGLVDAYRVRMLRLAGHGTCVTANAAAVVDDESIGWCGSGTHMSESTFQKPSRP
jgi:hypothetical protein